MLLDLTIKLKKPMTEAEVVNLLLKVSQDLLPEVGIVGIAIEGTEPEKVYTTLGSVIDTDERDLDTGSIELLQRFFKRLNEELEKQM